MQPWTKEWAIRLLNSKESAREEYRNAGLVLKTHLESADRQLRLAEPLLTAIENIIEAKMNE